MKDFGGTVISSRIRLARNAMGKKFPSEWTDEADAKAFANMVFDSVSFLGRKDLRLYYLDSLDEDSTERFRENYIISDTLLKHKKIASVITDSDGEISIMINEEDNIREQFMGRGYAVRELFDYAMDVDRNYIGKRIAYSKSERFGFLTACPSNLGSGLRASVMLFLPGIVKMNALKEITENRLPRGFTVRGIYGEGSSGDGYLFQISNEVTLGVREEDMISSLEDFVCFVTEFEAEKRYELKDRDVFAFRDSCGRAYGILSNAAILPYEEFLTLVSELKLGVILGFYELSAVKVFSDKIERQGIELIDDLIVAMREHNLVTWNPDGDDDDPYEEFLKKKSSDKNIYRAVCVRQFMEKYINKI